MYNKDAQDIQSLILLSLLHNINIVFSVTETIESKKKAKWICNFVA